MDSSINDAPQVIEGEKVMEEYSSSPSEPLNKPSDYLIKTSL